MWFSTQLFFVPFEPFRLLEWNWVFLFGFSDGNAMVFLYIIIYVCVQIIACTYIQYILAISM